MIYKHIHKALTYRTKPGNLPGVVKTKNCKKEKIN